MTPGNKPRLAAIVLAAGLSSRMGGPNKLLMDWRGRPLLWHALDLVASVDIAQRIVVTGRDAEAVSRVVPEGFEVVFNSRFTEGMGSSIASGVRALRPEIDGVLIFLGDMPDIHQTDVLAVIGEFDPGFYGCIAVPVYCGERGHPVLFARKHFVELAQLSGDSGACSVIDAQSACVVFVEASSGVLRDIDTTGDLG